MTVLLPRLPRRLPGLAAAACCAAALAGCSSAPSGPVVPVTSGTGPAPTATDGVAATASGADAEAAADCDGDALEVTAGAREAAAGGTALTLNFRNTGGEACRVSGYPQVAGTRDGEVADGSVAEEDTSAGADDVVLAAGGSATATLTAGTAATGGGECDEDYTGISVTPPGASEATDLPVTLPACATLEVAALTAG